MDNKFAASVFTGIHDHVVTTGQLCVQAGSQVYVLVEVASEAFDEPKPVELPDAGRTLEVKAADACDEFRPV
jgi:hypothetical protein